MRALRSIEDLDDRVRPGLGVGVFAVLRGGEMRIILDDLRRSGSSSPASWSTRAFVTHAEVSAERFLAHELTDEEYRSIGAFVAARLAALAASS